MFGQVVDAVNSYGWRNHLWNNAVVLVSLVVLDHIVMRPFLAKNYPGMGYRTAAHNSARWFFVHAGANAFVCAAAMRSMWSVLSDPLHSADSQTNLDRSFWGDASVWPLTIINSVHVYHMIGGFRLTGADYFHHLLFIPTLGFPGQVLPWGALSNWLAFFISGLPGGLDYFVLGLVKLGYVDKMTEKRLNANQNVWLRNPGILTAVILLYQSQVYGTCQAPFFFVLLQLTLPAYNGIYYCKQAVANFSVHWMLAILDPDKTISKRLTERTSKMTGLQVMTFREALQEPQRGS